MSYILNAIRKSELERNINQSSTLENKILEKQEDAQKKTSAWMIVLVMVNVFFLSYLIWMFTKDDKKEVINEKALVSVKPEVIVKTEQQPPIIKTTKKDQHLSIAEQLKKQQTKANPVFEQEKTKPLIIVEQSPELKKEKKESLPPKKLEVATSPKKKVVPVVNKQKKDLPFLSELAYDFRRTVPDLDINVFVYSENKNNRFIMVNMKKYVPGKLMETGMKLKEIRINSIVVEYKNKVFQIKRK